MSKFRDGAWQPQSEAMQSVLLPLKEMPVANVYKWKDQVEDLQSCSCCKSKSWWTEATSPENNWRCGTCHPPVHLSSSDIREKDPRFSARPLCAIDKPVGFRVDEKWRKRIGSKSKPEIEEKE